MVRGALLGVLYHRGTRTGTTAGPDVSCEVAKSGDIGVPEHKNRTRFCTWLGGRIEVALAEIINGCVLFGVWPREGSVPVGKSREEGA